MVLKSIEMILNTDWSPNIMQSCTCVRCCVMPLCSYGEVEYFKRTNAGKKYVRKLIVDKSTAFNAYQENLN